MKKGLLLTAAVVLSMTAAFSQKQAVKSAKRALDKKQFTEARTFINEAIQNEETANNPETWKIAGDIANKIFDEENAKELLGQPSNKNTMYSALFELYAPYLKADSLGQLPDAKGKIKNKERKDIAAILKANHIYYINAGLHYNDLQESLKASKCFEIFWDMPTLPLYEGKTDGFVLDSTYQIIKYYTIFTAIQAEDHKRALSLLERASKEDFIENNVWKESDIYELFSAEYLQLGDTVKYREAITLGAEKYPTSRYFIPNLINIYIAKEQYEEAIDYLDRAAKNDPEQTCIWKTTKGNLLSDKKEFSKAEKEYLEALEYDNNCEQALELISILYTNNAFYVQEEAEKTKDRKIQQEKNDEIKNLYLKALPYLERYHEKLKEREATNSEIKSAMIKLRNVYYNLSVLGVDKSAELDKMSELLGE